MANKMLIDATHPEETRVVVLRGNRVEEFDFESASRKQLRGNIYLAKVTRVEPSLQAAFVDYGGNRHGFLAFSEIHPDYYQIPVADRQALLDEDSRQQREDDEENGGGGRHRRRSRGGRHRRRGADRNRSRDVVRSDAVADGTAIEENAAEGFTSEAAALPAGDTPPDVVTAETAFSAEESGGQPVQALDEFSHEAAAPLAAEPEPAPLPTSEEVSLPVEPEPAAAPDAFDETQSQADARADTEPLPTDANAENGDDNGAGGENSENGDEEDDDDDEDDEDEENGDENGEEEDSVESVGGDALEEVQERAPRYRRHYKIQEVIKRRQVMLVQVVKEERGTKGAALTTYLSLAGRYSVLMPNTARGGGISRKVTSAEDRRKMKEVAEELDVPEGMGVILRTAGANRTKTEIKRDFEYLLRLWENVRDLTLKSTAPTLVYEEGSLVKRSIRDLYHSDIDDIVVEGEAAYRDAKDFMRMLMPSHARNVHLYHDAQPIFARYGIEPQLDAMFTSTVQLKSGGYVVINQTEALVAIDVNSGRATREHSIEETALKTNSEAAVEIARQLRLRDLAGLIVIDFIDMDENRNNRTVERKMKEALKSDRARIQVGRISHFGLLEMSRQRIRSSVLESSTEVCPQCGGTGHVRSVASVALQLVRALEETLLKGATHNLIVRTRSDVAIYVLNHKRAHLRMLEERFKVAITITADPTLSGHPPFAIDRGEQVMTLEQAKALVTIKPDSVMPYAEEEEEDEIAEEEAAEEATATEGEAESEDAEAAGERKGRRRRRGRRRRGAEAEAEETGFTHETVAEHRVEHGEDFAPLPESEDSEGAEPAEGSEDAEREARDDGARKRRRGRRGGRRNRRGRGESDNGNGHPREDEDGAQDGGEDAPAFQSAPSPHEDEPPHHEPQRTSPPAKPLATSEPPVADDRPRRRSTIREAAPVSWSSDADAPPAQQAIPVEPAQPEPQAADNAPTETEKPRRFGWWSKRG
jgi:ribonuclease E